MSMRIGAVDDAARVFFASRLALPLAAHHAFGGEFDANRPVLLKGKVVKVEWVNPHAWIHVEVTKDGRQEGSLDGGGRQSEFAASPRR